MHLLITSCSSSHSLRLVINLRHVGLNLKLLKLLFHLFSLLFLSLLIVHLIVQKLLHVSLVLVFG